MSRSFNCGDSCNDKNRFSGAAKVGTFNQQDLLAAIQNLGIELSEELLAEIAADFADRQSNPRRPQLAKLKAMPSPRHHDHCHRAWVCDDNGNCDWEWICE